MEKEKDNMLAGRVYRSSDTELTADRLNAKEFNYEYNHSKPSDLAKRTQLLTTFLGKADTTCYIEPPFYCDYGYNIHVGKHFYANYNLTILDCCHVTIGNHVLLGPNVSLLTADHPIDAVNRNAGLEFAKPITLKDNVWIGGGSTVISGVTIGENTIIGAGSVVTKDIPANVIAVGNPCRVLRAITEADKKTFETALLACVR